MPDSYGNSGPIPPEFFRGLSDAEWKSIYESEGILNADLCARLWRMTDRNGESPESLELLVSRSDVERLWPIHKKRRGK